MLVFSKKHLALTLAGLLLAGYLYFLEQPEEPVPDHITVAARVSDMPVFYVKVKEPKLALTFDISWGTRTLPKVLEILQKEQVKATFFLSGPWANRHQDLVKAIAAAGHEVASHGQDHVNLSQYDQAAVVQNISAAHSILKTISGQEPRFFRPPNGDYDDLVVASGKSLGYDTIIWSVDSLDWKNPGASYMERRVVDLAFPGSIVLFHASDSSKQVHLALGSVIQQLRAKGYHLITLGELFAAGEASREDPRGRPDYPPIKLEDVKPAP